MHYIRFKDNFAIVKINDVIKKYNINYSNYNNNPKYEIYWLCYIKLRLYILPFYYIIKP